VLPFKLLRMKNFTVIFLFIILSVCGPAKATHIVGGEFQLKHINGYSYSLSLKMYFDEVNGNPEILTSPQDQSLVAYIYSKATNRLVTSVTLEKETTSKVKYTDPLCSRAELKTLVLIYGGRLTLRPELFSDPKGYYIVWERCCRNGVINNIIDPGGTGQAFYMEFPPVTENGSPFYNSSPTLFPPLSDYGCVNKPFYYDFSGTDPDGDSLIYSMVAPFAGSSSVFNVMPTPASPAPYPSVIWLNGYNANNMISGKPSMRINPATGQLFVVPDRSGLFVFGVRCEEYRNGKKIGEVRRDFQMMVLDCPVNDPPKIVVKPPLNKEFLGKKDTVTFNIGEERCFTFSIKDPQINTKLNVKLRPVNFSEFFVQDTEYSKYLFTKNDSLTFDICFPDCPLPGNEPYIVEVIAKDNGCSLPLLDTAILVVNVVPLPNSPAILSTDLTTEELTIKAGTPINFNIRGNDVDISDSLIAKAEPVNFSFEDLGIEFSEKVGFGSVTAAFSWTPNCDFLNLNEQDEFEIDLLLEEVDKCNIKHFYTKRIKIKVEDNPNEPPILLINKNIPNNAIQAYVGQTIAFDVYAEDPDAKFIALEGQGKGFNLQDVGISFQNMTGKSTLSSPFLWTPTCDHLSDTAYSIQFVGFDRSCFGYEYDTIAISIEVKDYNQDEKKFIPPNVFTPNGDGKNDVFTLENLPEDPELANTFSLPKEVCGNVFEEIVIVNRWGKVIFKDRKRDFVWDAKGFPAGAYFYTIKYSKNIFKGTISVLY
jgi:gliding motility-associated-like protein